MREKIAMVVPVVPVQKKEGSSHTYVKEAPKEKTDSTEQHVLFSEDQPKEVPLEPVEGVNVVTPEQAELNHPRDPDNPDKPLVQSIDFTQHKSFAVEDKIEGKTFEDVVPDIARTRPCSLCQELSKSILIKSSNGEWVCLNCIADAAFKILEEPQNKNVV